MRCAVVDIWATPKKVRATAFWESSVAEAMFVDVDIVVWGCSWCEWNGLDRALCVEQVGGRFCEERFWAGDSRDGISIVETRDC